MMAMPSLTASSANASPTRMLRSSDSTTHGPAMRNGLLSAAKRWAMSVGELRQFPRRFGARMQLVVVDRRADETRKQWMRPHRARLQLGMELAAEEPGMPRRRQLDHLDQRAVRRQPRGPKPVLGQHVAVGVRHLVAVAMALAHFRGIVRLRRQRSGTEPAGVGAQPHRAAHLLNPFL